MDENLRHGIQALSPQSAGAQVVESPQKPLLPFPFYVSATLNHICPSIQDFKVRSSAPQGTDDEDGRIGAISEIYLRLSENHTGVIESSYL
jgi:hypothetical protein